MNDTGVTFPKGNTTDASMINGSYATGICVTVCICSVCSGIIFGMNDTGVAFPKGDPTNASMINGSYATDICVTV